MNNKCSTSPTSILINDLNKPNSHTTSSTSSTTTHLHQYHHHHHLHHHKLEEKLVEEEDCINLPSSPSLQKSKTFSIPIKNQYRPFSSPNLAENANKQPASVSFSDMTQIKYMSSNSPPQQIHLQPKFIESTSHSASPLTRSCSTSKTSSVIQTMYQSIKKNANNSINTSSNNNNHTSTPMGKQAPSLDYESTESSQSESTSSSRSNSIIRNVATYNIVRARSGSPKVYSCHNSACSLNRSAFDKKLVNRSCSSMGSNNYPAPQQQQQFHQHQEAHQQNHQAYQHHHQQQSHPGSIDN